MPLPGMSNPHMMDLKLSRIFTISPAVSGRTQWDLDTHGPMSLTTNGSWTFTPLTSFSCSIAMWGAGGNGSFTGASGGATTFNGMSAGGGGSGGANGSGTNASGGGGGSASGGDTNTNGNAGQSGQGWNIVRAVGGAGGSAPSGGGGGAGAVDTNSGGTGATGSDGGAPGGGGGGGSNWLGNSGSDQAGGGGGSGALVQKAYPAGYFTIGVPFTIVVGAPAANGGGNGGGGTGGVGRFTMT